MAPAGAAETVSVFVPSHVTSFFSVHEHEEPAKAGSRGAGLTLTDGVECTLERAPETTVEVDGAATEVAAVDHVLEAFEPSARIEIEATAPIGAGFGLSGAMALGTAIGLNAFASEARTANELARIAHVADVRAGTGLGDVVAQLRGGIPIRREPGAPPHGELDGVPGAGRVEYTTRGELSTEEIITGDVDAINGAGEAALAGFLERPSLPRLFAHAREFARDSGLLPEELAVVIEAVEEAGGEAAMGMLGRTVFTLGTGLTDAGYDARACRIDHGGARIASDGVVYYPPTAEFEA